ncbi:hypothetical protein [Paraburkholderia humisilvae]|uniref:hypothetical protein n=1 Tax=Paraburkholderia humisilvae TaxID=627669 RepID=UPI0015829657|nr:hypothetical protein [Paraburkholderia humisilvae]
MAYEDHVAMIRNVARALGPELTSDVAFVGGCATASLLTDHYMLTQVRHTDNVDVIVRIIHMAGCWTFQRVLQLHQGLGGKEDPTPHGAIPESTRLRLEAVE